MVKQLEEEPPALRKQMDFCVFPIPELCAAISHVRTFTRLEQKKQPGSGNAAWISCSLHFESKAEAHPLNPYQKLKAEGNVTKNEKNLN